MKTVLYEKHCALGAKMVEFSGWEMPLQYQGIIAEHHNVRQRVGLFDVSHMGRILISGKDAEPFLEFICTNRIAGKKNFSVIYTVLAAETGGCIDDVLVYKQDSEHFFLVCNAGNRQQVLKHLQEYSKDFNVLIKDHFSEDGILSLQGPLASPIVKELFGILNLKAMQFCPATYKGQKIILSTTGYTGAGGFEFYASNSIIPDLWDQLLLIGKLYGIMPVGLGARDTLRLEMGYALYGHEISETIASIESVAAWAVKLDKENFLGKQSLVDLKSGGMRSEYAIEMQDAGIARAGYDVVIGGNKIGIVTSGTHSPTLNKAIAIVLVDRKLQKNDQVEVKIRSNLCKAKIVDLPFINKDES
jgi:aminomethyltransferase